MKRKTSGVQSPNQNGGQEQVKKAKVTAGGSVGVGGKSKKPDAKKKSKKNKNNKKSERQKASDAFYIVPWMDSSYWDNICKDFKAQNFEKVIEEILIWRERVPALPVGAESTLFLLQAIVFDKGDTAGVSEDQSRSLYSLAIVRYMNHVSHLATQETGGNAPMSRLASTLNVPDWIVDLRHEVSHGSALPSLDILRSAGDFILEWLSNNYWAYSEESLQDSILTRGSRKGKECGNKKEMKEEVRASTSQALSIYIASKVYKLRGLKRITDPEITHSLPGQPAAVTPKQAIGICKTQVANLLTVDPGTVTAVFAQEMIPDEEFIQGLASILEAEVEEVFTCVERLWWPLVELMRRRSKVPMLCTLMAKLLVEKDLLNKNGKLFGALWLEKLLSCLEEEERKYPLRLKKILVLLMGCPDPVYEKFFSRLLRLLEKNLGTYKVEQLQALFNIWTDDDADLDRESQTAAGGSGADLYSVENLDPQGSHSTEENGHIFPDVDFLSDKSIRCWQLDSHGQNYWRKIPLGTAVEGV